MIQLSEEITKIKGGVSSPKGFEAKGVHCCAIQKDLGAIISEAPAVSAAVYTQSHFQAAPLKVTQESLKRGASGGYRQQRDCQRLYGRPRIKGRL